MAVECVSKSLEHPEQVLEAVAVFWTVCLNSDLKMVFIFKAFLVPGENHKQQNRTLVPSHLLGGEVTNLLLYFYCCLIVDKKNPLVQKWNLLFWRFLNIWSKSHSHGNLSASAQTLVWALVLHSQGPSLFCHSPFIQCPEGFVTDSSFSPVSRTPAQAGQHHTLGPTWHFQMNIWGFYQTVCSEHILYLCVTCSCWAEGMPFIQLTVNSAFGWFLLWAPGAGDQCSQHLPLPSAPVPALNHVGIMSHFLAPLDGVVAREQWPGGLWMVIPSLPSCAVHIRVLLHYFHFKIPSS